MSIHTPEFMVALGGVASVLTTASFIPQAIRTIRTRDTSGISLTMYIMLEVGIVLWAIYGYYFELFPVLIGNIVTGLFAGIILVLKLREPAGTEPTSDVVLD